MSHGKYDSERTDLAARQEFVKRFKVGQRICDRHYGDKLTATISPGRIFGDINDSLVNVTDIRNSTGIKVESFSTDGVWHFTEITSCR